MEIIKSILMIMLSILGIIQQKENKRLLKKGNELARELFQVKTDKSKEIYNEKINCCKKILDAKEKEEKYKKIIKEILYMNERTTDNEEIKIGTIPKEEENHLNIEITNITDNMRVLKLVNNSDTIE